MRVAVGRRGKARRVGFGEKSKRKSGTARMVAEKLGDVLVVERVEMRAEEKSE